MRPSAAFYKWFYDHIHSHYYNLLMRWCFLPFGGEGRVRREMLEGLRFPRGGAVLDLCCGTGNTTFALAERAGAEARIVGLDLSSGMLRVARRRGRYPSVSFVEGDAASIGLADGTFDAVVVSHALHEMPGEKRLRVLEESRRILKRGGEVAALELDSPRSLLLRWFVALWFFYWLPFNFETPTRRDMLKQGLENELAEAGFKEIRKSSHCRGVFQVVTGQK